MGENDARPMRPWLALTLLIPAPVVGAFAGMVWPAGELGHILFVASKLWLVALPVGWHLLVDRGRPSWSPPRAGGLGVGALLGLATAVVIGAVGWLVAGGSLDPAAVRDEALGMGLATPGRFLAAAAGWIFVNSVLEEYVWRWFVYRQLEAVTSPGFAVVGSAVGFTVHHVVALATYLGPGLVALASLGVFAGGLMWSLLYRRYRSIWPGWLAHAGADVAIYAIGYAIVF